ncbi:uncharacterized protein LOC126802417 [Argentina anserina]|uniref:uncharacterized protein LOC126802417 n=1 Tax=Argentina anserina TaxID=57926 RepID=UPI0021766486|nr:uncharacterized protein LOC126802417 [Potentilla anserina]
MAGCGSYSEGFPKASVWAGLLLQKTKDQAFIQYLLLVWNRRCWQEVVITFHLIRSGLVVSGERANLADWITMSRFSNRRQSWLGRKIGHGIVVRYRAKAIKEHGA